MAVRPWYKERYIVKQLHGEPIYGYRIREEGTDRIIAKELVGLEADEIIEAVSQRTKVIAGNN